MASVSLSLSSDALRGVAGGERSSKRDGLPGGVSKMSLASSSSVGTIVRPDMLHDDQNHLIPPVDSSSSVRSSVVMSCLQSGQQACRVDNPVKKNEDVSIHSPEQHSYTRHIQETHKGQCNEYETCVHTVTPGGFRHRYTLLNKWHTLKYDGRRRPFP